MKKRVEKEGGKKRRRKRRRHPSPQMRLDRRQKQVSLDRFLVKVAQKEKESTDSSDSVSDNETRPTQ
jgi:hypothetical protein